MDRRGRASEVVDLVNLEQNRLNDVVSDELKPRISEVVDQVVLPSREEIINDDHAVPSRDQTVHKVAPHEPGPTGHHYPQPLVLHPQRHSPLNLMMIFMGLVQGPPPPHVGLRLLVLVVGLKLGLVGPERTTVDGEGDGGDGHANEDEEQTVNKVVVVVIHAFSSSFLFYGDFFRVFCFVIDL